MTDEKALTIAEPQAIDRPREHLRFEPRNFAEAVDAAEYLHGSGLLPDEIKNPAAATLIIVKGAERGWSMMQSFDDLMVIKGKVAMYADTMVAECLARKDVCEYFEKVEASATSATMRAKRVGRPEQTSTWTIERAKAAGLMRSDMYTKYPERMLLARAKSELAKDTFPEILRGIYTPDELRAADARDVGPAPAPEPPPAPVEDAELVDEETPWGEAVSPELEEHRGILRTLLKSACDGSAAITPDVEDIVESWHARLPSPGNAKAVNKATITDAQAFCRRIQASHRIMRLAVGLQDKGIEFPPLNFDRWLWDLPEKRGEPNLAAIEAKLQDIREESR